MRRTAHLMLLLILMTAGTTLALPDAPVPGSCQPWNDGGITASPCGSRWQAGGIASDPDLLDGCSCEATCGYQGVCCADAEQYCQSVEIFGYAPPTPSSGGFDTATMDGQQWVQLVRPQSVAALNGTTAGNTLGGFQYRGLAPAEGRFAGLTGVDLTTFEEKDESVGCWVRQSPDVANNGFLYVGALSACGDWDLGTNGADWQPQGCNTELMTMKATCSAAALAEPPPSLGSVLDRSASQTLYTGCENSTTSCGNPGYKTTVLGPVVDAQGHQSFPLFERVMMTEYDRLYSDRWPSNRCRIYESGGNWAMVAFSDQTLGDAVCSAYLVTDTGGGTILPTACPQTETASEYHDGGGGGASCAEETHSVVFSAQAYGGGHDLDPDQTAGRPLRENYTEISMFSDTSHACFLQQYWIDGDLRHTSEGDDRAACQVYERNSRWWLRAETAGDGNVICDARCLRNPEGWPWDPPAENGAAYPATWPPAPTHVADSAQTRANPGLVGPHMELFQAGDYDRPLVIVEGFDANDVHSAGDHLRDFAPLVRLALDHGIDVWIVDQPDGGAALDELARRVAMALRYAYRHDFFNALYGADELAVVGFSAGGLTTRMSMAYWQQGRFADPADPLYLADVYGYDAPVSHFASVGSPHEGATVPLTLQLLIQDVGGDFSLGNPHRALNSPAAEEMLEARIDDTCNGVVTEWCEGHRVLVDDAWLECDTGTTCGNFGNRCPVDESRFRDTSTDWPTGPAMAGVSNGGWGVLSCQRLPATERQACLDRYGAGDLGTTDEIGLLHYVLDGPLNNCDRDSTIRAFLSDRDLTPGDVIGGGLAGVTLGGVPPEVQVLEVDQFLPYQFVPTGSALACGGQQDDASCRAANRAAGRFDHVASNPDGVNDFHDGLHHRLAHELMAFALDAWSADADGWCDPATNPVLAQYNAKLGVTPADPAGLAACLDPQADCHDGRADAFPGAPEDCDDVDNDCDGTVDEGFPGKGDACDNGQLGACYRQGTMVCTTQGSGLECSAETVQPGSEQCGDGIDNDCDGTVDEGCSTGSCRKSCPHEAS